MRMKIMNKANLLMVTLLAIFVQPVSFAAGTPRNKKANDFIRAIALDDDADVAQPEELTERIMEATKVMDSARDMLFDEKAAQLDDVDNAKTIIKQNAIIVQTQHTLDKLQHEQLAQQSPVSPTDEGYLSQLMSGVKNVGTGFLERMQSWYGYTEDEKELARKIIDGLEQQKVEITHKYVPFLKGLTGDKRDTLKKRYRAVVVLLDAEIRQQKYITGEEMSLKKKLLWGTAAATVAGVLAHKYSAGAPEVTQQPGASTPVSPAGTLPVKAESIQAATQGTLVQQTVQKPVQKAEEQEFKKKIAGYDKKIVDMKKELADLKNKKIEIPTEEYNETPNERAFRLEQISKKEQREKRIVDMQGELEQQRHEKNIYKQNSSAYQKWLQEDPQRELDDAQQNFDEFKQRESWGSLFWGSTERNELEDKVREARERVEGKSNAFVF